MEALEFMKLEQCVPDLTVAWGKEQRLQHIGLLVATSKVQEKVKQTISSTNTVLAHASCTVLPLKVSSRALECFDL